MNKLEMIKLGTGIATTAGTIHVVSGIVGTLVPRRNILEKTLTMVGTIAIGSVLAEVTRGHIDKRVDEIIAWLDQNAKK